MKKIAIFLAFISWLFIIIPDHSFAQGNRKKNKKNEKTDSERNSDFKGSAFGDPARSRGNEENDMKNEEALDGNMKGLNSATPNDSTLNNPDKGKKSNKNKKEKKTKQKLQ